METDPSSRTTKHEMLVAALISDFAQWGLGRSLGSPTNNDDGSMPGLVDVLFEGACPPVALEVTSIVDGDHRSTHKAAGPVARRLDAYAKELGQGGWEVHLAAGTPVKPLESEIRRLFAEGIELRSDGVGVRRNDLPRGVISLWLYSERASEARIATWKGANGERLRGIRGELAHALAENCAKLASMDGYEKHLAVEVLGLRATEPGESPPPKLPVGVDYLWVVRRPRTPGGTGPVVWLAPDPLGWKVFGEPWEAF